VANCLIEPLKLVNK